MSNTKIKAGQFSGIVGNGTDGYFLMTNGDGTMAWQPAGTPSPTVTSVTYPGDDTAADPAGGQSVTLTGTNFATGATVTIGGTTAPIVSFVSATELTIATPAKAAGDYDIVVTNTDGGTATFVDGISYNGIPSWTTASGSLGTFASDTTISTITLQASEPDAGTITFNITSGALPTGLSLTGADIDGTTSKETADTLYNFTVTAIDDENQSTPRAFSITVEKYIVPAPENFEIVTYTGNGGTQAITSKIGKAASFNGSSSYISNVANIGVGDSLSALFKPNSDSVRFYTNYDGTYDFFSITIEYDGSQYRVRIFLRNNTSTYRYLATDYFNLTNDWHHFALNIDGYTSYTAYIDGAPVAFTSTQSGSTPNTHPTSNNQSFGRSYVNGSTTYSNAVLDQYRIFNKALSQQEVTTLYNETYASSTKSTTDIFNDGSGIALYELDEDANSSNFGQAAVFNGSSSKITLPSTLRDVFDSSTRSLSFWFQTTSTTTLQAIFRQDHSSDSNGRTTIVMGSDGTVSVLVGDAGSYPTTSSLNANQWYHVAVSVNGGSYTAYLNGVSFGTATNNNYSDGSFFQFGANNESNQYSFSGKLDQVRIYNTALSSGDITNLYNESNVPTSGLVAHYKLDGNAEDVLDTYDGTASNVTYSAGVYGGTPTNVNFLGMAFQPDLVWIKNRDTTDHHAIVDTVRGIDISGTKYISSSETNQELTSTNMPTSVESNGFTLSGAGGRTNTLNEDYVAWCWKAGGVPTPNNNTQGTITSTVSANPDAGFSIVKYTGNGGGATLGHGLSQQVEMVITKSTESDSQWMIYHKDLTGNTSGDNPYNLYFSTDAELDLTAFGAYDSFTSSVFPVSRQSAATAHNNNINIDYIAYCFHSVDGYQKVGSYIGGGLTKPVTGLGFKPRFLMIKNATANNSYCSWAMYDNLRNIESTDRVTDPLYANRSYQEGLRGDGSSGSGVLDVSFNDDGFTIENNGVEANNSGETHIYLAIA